jgi:hypothetical protein
VPLLRLHNVSVMWSQFLRGASSRATSLYGNPRIVYTRKDPSFYQREARITIKIRFPHEFYAARATGEVTFQNLEAFAVSPCYAPSGYNARPFPGLLERSPRHRVESPRVR